MQGGRGEISVKFDSRKASLRRRYLSKDWREVKEGSCRFREGRGFQVDGTAKSLGRGRRDLFQEQHRGQEQSR